MRQITWESRHGVLSYTYQVITVSVFSTNYIDVHRQTPTRHQRGRTEIQNVSLHQNCMVEGPNGDTVLALGDNESGGGKKRIAVTTPSVGAWLVMCSDEQTYTAFVWGLSDVTFQVHFLDLSDNPLIGDPIEDTNITLGIEVSGMESLEFISSVEIIYNNGVTDIYNVSKQGSGRHHNFYELELTVPDQAFRVGLTATDTRNNTVHRQSPMLFQPKAFTVSISQITTDTSPGSNVVFVYNIYNHRVSSQTFSTEVILDTLQPDEFSSNATAGDEIEVPSYTKQYGAFAVMISSSASVGTSCNVILSVKRIKGNVELTKLLLIVQPNNILSTPKSELMTSPETNPRKSTLTPRTTSQDITSYSNSTAWVTNSSIVEKKSSISKTITPPWTISTISDLTLATSQTDVSPPAFNKVSFIDRCYIKVKCTAGEWVVHFVVQDNESGIHRVMAEDTTHSNVHTENFPDGLAKVPVHGNISTSCCQNEAVLVVEDMKGNWGRYHVTYERQNSTGNGNNTTEDVTKHHLRELAATVVGLCAGILAFIILLTFIIQFKSKIVSGFSSIKFPRPEKQIEMRVPHRVSVNIEVMDENK
ncbi:uncharacterized protein LOC125646783 isoform X2 [Ostrea edulis]|uniref:uncharacterized protein LOC125646783 isoform X2 n=1 Tax=Ostrea edulis TaxID=37623 RepID=UPI0024AE9783|nr:uncharacterized protein LOC125646783 isoform X2 [Ostrea edulis]